MDGNSQNVIFYTKPSEAFLMALDALIDSHQPTHSVATEVPLMSHVMKVQQLHEKRIFRPLDEQFARFVEQQGGHESLVLLAAILSAELGKGNSCLNVYDEKDVANDLSRVFGVSSELSELIKPFYYTQNFRGLFAQSSLVSLTGDDPCHLYLTDGDYFSIVIGIMGQR